MAVIGRNLPIRNHKCQCPVPAEFQPSLFTYLSSKPRPISASQPRELAAR